MLHTLTGAHGVGKTTLLNELRKVEKRFYISDGFTRPVRRFLSANRPDYDINFEQLLINDLTQWAWNNYLDQNAIIGRSLVDVILYSQYYTKVDTSSIEKILEKTKEKVKFFYIPIEFDLHDDGERYIIPKDQENIDKKFQLFFKEKDITFITISGSVEQRLKILRENLTYSL